MAGPAVPAGLRGIKLQSPVPSAAIYLTPSIINNLSISPTFIDLQRGSSPRSFPPDSLLLPRIRPPAGALIPTKGSLSFPNSCASPERARLGVGVE